MPRTLRIAAVLVAFLLTLSACADTTTQASSPPTSPPQAPTSAPLPSPTAAPVVTARPTATPLLAANVLVAGVDVGGLTPEAARSKLGDALAALQRPLDIEFSSQQISLKPADIAFELPLDDLIAQAQAAKPGARVPLAVRYDEAKLRAALEGLAKQADQPPAFSVISSTKTISRSFVLAGGARLDLDAAVKQIDERLRTPGGSRRVTLSLSPSTSAGVRPAPEQLQEQIEQMAARWNGVVGVYVYDLASDQVQASLNEGSVFSGASVMKVPILLWSYINLPSFTPDQEKALKKMIVESDNLSANRMLAASVGGSGTESALDGALQMTEMLKQLGLKHTYQYTPYEATQYLNLKKIKIKSGPAVEGPKPYTEADPRLRSTPAEMSQIFLLIYQCGQGKGVLLEKFAKSLSATRCREMLARLEQNGDHSRMVAGLPAGTHVAHKSGWVEDMQGDVGIVHSPGGDFLVAIYIYTKIDIKKGYLEDRVAAPVIASFARLIYSYFNPNPIK